MRYLLFLAVALLLAPSPARQVRAQARVDPAAVGDAPAPTAAPAAKPAPKAPAKATAQTRSTAAKPTAKAPVTTPPQTRPVVPPPVTKSNLPPVAPMPPVPPPGPVVPAYAPVAPVIPPLLDVPQRPPTPVTPAVITADAPGAVTSLPAGGLRITFGDARSDLNPATEAALKAYAHHLPADAFVTVSAFAPAQGDDLSAPRRLSLARAATVRSVLLGEGMASPHVLLRAMGGVAGAPGDGPADRADIVIGRTATPVAQANAQAPAQANAQAKAAP